MAKIAFIGTHGVGKTTLCYDLAAALKKHGAVVDIVKEVARLSPLPINRQTSLDAQMWILSTQIADNFRNNSLKNGLVPVIVPEDIHGWLLANPGAVVSVDVESRTLTLPDGRTVEFPLDGFSRHCLMEGIDQLGYLMSQDAAIGSFEQERAWQP